MKAILEAIPGYLYVIVALVVAFLMLHIVFDFTRFFAPEEDVLNHSNRTISEDLANVITNCWEKHRRGLDHESDVCRTLRIDSPTLITEKDVTEFLNCELLPNTECLPDDCSFCNSSFYNNTDKIRWNVSSAKANIAISYSGSEKIIFVKEYKEVV